MSMSMSVELSRESPLVDREVTAFGFERKELLSRLKKEEDFRDEFLCQFEVVMGLVKELKEYEKTVRKQAKSDAQTEKEKAERTRLMEVIKKIEEKDEGVTLEENFFETNTVKSLKEWVKNYRTSIKATKEAEKQAKIAAKEAKEAVKQAKAATKLKRQLAQMEKMGADLQKWNDKVEFEVQSFEDKLDNPKEHFAEMKAYHTRVKLIVQLAKFSEGVEGVPEYDTMEIDDDDLKEMHTRCKLLNQLGKLDVTIDYGTEKTIDELKTAIKEAKAAATTADDN